MLLSDSVSVLLSDSVAVLLSDSVPVLLLNSVSVLLSDNVSVSESASTLFPGVDLTSTRTSSGGRGVWSSIVTVLAVLLTSESLLLSGVCQNCRNVTHNQLPVK